MLICFQEIYFLLENILYYFLDSLVHLIVLKNAANAAAFIDVEVELSFISEAKTVIEKITIVLFNYYEPNSETIFSINIEDCPKATSSYSARIKGAEGIIN